ncbi:hypothetical protein D6789_00975 [Candidatus Woesearchaeota archaeon]|nr:MAG: hypothetical protein D6789_00975 [Candidatus Woesearchaeota archaeon]
MAFSRRFPRDVKGSNYPVWEEVYLSDEEEEQIDKEQRDANLQLFRESIADARKLLAVESQGPVSERDVLRVAATLFDKRASHLVYWKEQRTKEKFDKAYQKQ